MSLAALEIIRDPEAAAVLLEPRRQAMLRLLQKAPNTASGLGKLLEMPRQKVNYHLHELERAGLVGPVESKTKGSVTERRVQATAAHYLVSPEALGELGEDAATQRDRFSSAYLIATAGRIIREMAVLVVRAAQAGKRISTMTIETEIRFRTAQERTQFADELANFMVSMAAKYHDEGASGGRSFRVVTGAWPKITKGSGAGNATARVEE